MSRIIPKRKFSFITLAVITALYIGFIWWRSTLTAEDSTVESIGVLHFLKGICKSLGLGVELTDHIVRKSAHFCEFALLGCLSAWTGYLYNHRVLRNLTTVGFVSLAVAVVDEMIQLAPVGRSAEVADVVLDFSGAVAGVIFFIIIVSIVKLFKKS